MDARAIASGIGAAAGLMLGLVLLATGQQWILSLGAGFIVADVAYALLAKMQTGDWAPLRFAAGLVAFAVVTYVGIIGFGDFGTQSDVDPNTFVNAKAANTWALILTIAMVVGAVVYFGLELLQTGRLESLSHLFGTRTLLLMVVGIAVNIILGQTVASALKIPIYLDSIGTILRRRACGPIPGRAHRRAVQHPLVVRDPATIPVTSRQPPSRSRRSRLA